MNWWLTLKTNINLLQVRYVTVWCTFVLMSDWSWTFNPTCKFWAEGIHFCFDIKLVLMNHHHNKRNTLNKTNHHKCSNKCDKKVRVAGGDGSLRLPCGVITHAGRYYYYFVITAVVTFISNCHHLYHYHD